MPGMGLVIEGAVQQAPQRGRHWKEVFMVVRQAGTPSIHGRVAIASASPLEFLLRCFP